MDLRIEFQVTINHVGPECREDLMDAPGWKLSKPGTALAQTAIACASTNKGKEYDTASCPDKKGGLTQRGGPLVGDLFYRIHFC